MKQLVGIKLSSGDTILGYVVNETETDTTIHNPLMIKYLWDDVPPTIYATPFCPLTYSNESFANLVRRNIVAVFKPSDMLEEYYINAIENVLKGEDEELDELEEFEVSPQMQSNTSGIIH